MEHWDHCPWHDSSGQDRGRVNAYGEPDAAPHSAGHCPAQQRVETNSWRTWGERPERGPLSPPNPHALANLINLLLLFINLGIVGVGCVGLGLWGLIDAHAANHDRAQTYDLLLIFVILAALYIPVWSLLWVANDRLLLPISSPRGRLALLQSIVLVLLLIVAYKFFPPGSKASGRELVTTKNSRPLGMMQGEIAAAYADFSTAKIRVKNMRVTPGIAFAHNKGTGKLTAWAAGFTDTFVLPTSGTYNLVVTHLSSLNDSPLRACRGNGYSPVTIQLNGTMVASHYDPAENHDGMHQMVTDKWPIVAPAGQNTLQWTMNDACTQYWIQRIELQSAPTPQLRTQH
jgi:hypothetical protein